MNQIRSVAVLGAGTMGAQIAAHVANAGFPVLLLDLDAGVAKQGFERAQKLKPDPFFTRDAASLVALGGFDQDLPRVAQYDWIIEAIVERLDAKQALISRVERHAAPTAVVSSNTSGIPISAIAEDRSPAFRRRWLGTHFFNPPRYLPLLEVIPTADTDPAVVKMISTFADHHLGKGIVIAKDTPNFIANRIGLHGVVRALDVLVRGDFTIEEIDAITGPALGRPRSATFRTMDIAGIDVLAHVMHNLAERLADPEEQKAFVLPPLVEELVKRGWIGEKAGQGFYQRQKGPASNGGKAGSEILTLDPKTMTYRPRKAPQLPSLDAAQSIEDVAERVRTLFLGNDRVGEFLRETLGRTLIYTARATPSIAHSIDDVDRAMRWGFGWELGPFELWDAIGSEAVLAACGVAEPPPLVRDTIETSHRQGPTTPRFRAGRVPPAAPELQILRSAKERHRVVQKNAGASLVDLGDGVLSVEFHSKMNTIGGDTVQMLTAGVAEATRNFAALVVGSDAINFSAGANLMLVLLEAQEENWDEIDLMVRAFQSAVLGLRYADVPVVVAPTGLTLGGGCEIVMHGDRVQAAAESYIGQVEAGVGLIPAGGGTKELLVRNVDLMPPGSAVDPLPFVERAFETIGFAKVSTSAPDARRYRYLRDVDAVTMNRERLMTDAKAKALERVREGYQRPPRRDAIPVGGEGVEAALKLGVHLAWRAGRISDHDALIGRKLARILSGGGAPHPTTVSEQYLLDLEREAFVSLCGTQKTQERMAYTLKTGKTLRN